MNNTKTETTPAREAESRETHTRGPWTVNAENSHHVPIIEGDKRPIAEIFGDGRDQRQANANLIALAPSYHEAATEAYQAWVTVPFDQKRMVKAMTALGYINAKVEGRAK